MIVLLFGDRQLGAIVVVARKRESLLGDVPLSVSALTTDDIAKSGFLDVFDFQSLIPHLDVNGNTGPLNTRFRIRRIGNAPDIVNSEPPVGFFVDGAFRTRSGSGRSHLFDIERIEVLRGPQTTLYGEDPTAGVVSVLTWHTAACFPRRYGITLRAHWSETTSILE